MCVEYLEKLYNVLSTVVTIINIDILTLLYTCVHYLNSRDVLHVQHMCTIIDFLLKKLNMLRDYTVSLSLKLIDIEKIVSDLSKQLQELRDKIVMATLRADDTSIVSHVRELMSILAHYLTKFSYLYFELCLEFVSATHRCLSL